MMNYLVELDLIPLYGTGRSFPLTRRHLVEAESISEALQKVDKEFAPGQDCVAIRVIEIGKKE